MEFLRFQPHFDDAVSMGGSLDYRIGAFSFLDSLTNNMITPMVARLVRDPFDRQGWLFELKWDGFRAIAEKDKLGVRLYSRNQKDFTKRFPVIAQEVAALDNVILDGEIVALDEHGHPRFEWLVNRGPQKGTIVYYVFDLLRLGDKDLRSEPLYRRKSLLQKVLRKNDTLRYVDHITTEGLAMYAGALALGLEGIVAKDAKSPYSEGPRVTGHWLKIKDKNYERQEKIEFHPRKSTR
jgi:bifunctional non-homologous end joining protein LigD